MRTPFSTTTAIATAVAAALTWLALRLQPGSGKPEVVWLRGHLLQAVKLAVSTAVYATLIFCMLPFVIFILPILVIGPLLLALVILQAAGPLSAAQWAWQGKSYRYPYLLPLGAIFPENWR